ncbi:MAG: 3-hydroxybutyryl-CoA dehydrogenase, partial [Lewinella sp.]|nr:3-hydroxybutyryl-CoA dehydrogenase [Lewinella sp.]
AQVFAQAGHLVRMIDVQQTALDRGLATIKTSLERLQAKEKIAEAEAQLVLERISLTTDLAAGVAEAELVVEAATENLELKQKIFQQLDGFAPAQAILATNTSSISITALAGASSRPDLVIGMHFMNPVPLMPLVEVICGFNTSEATTHTILALARSLGKTPVKVKDYPGFVANRVLMPMINEAITTLWQGVADVDAIDTVMKLGMAHPMGPLQLADFIGLDTCLAILRVMHSGLGQPHYFPCPLLVNMVEAGKLGKKSGEGFYDYRHGGKELRVAAAFV